MGVNRRTAAETLAHRRGELDPADHDPAQRADRGGALSVATRLPVALARRGAASGSPWDDTALLRHAGPTTDVFTGRTYQGGEIPLAELLAVYPVALLTADTP